MSICSSGCACTVSLRGIELDPGPVAMATTGTNHGWGAKSCSKELKVTAKSGIGVLMADGANKTPAAMPDKTWHRGGSDSEREACAKHGSAAGSGNGGTDSGWLMQRRLRRSWARRRCGCVQIVAQAAACSRTVVLVRVAVQGKLRARRGALSRGGSKEGNVIENEEGGGGGGGGGGWGEAFL